jgi:hypothetical protein
MQRLEEYRRRLGYQPWAAFELEAMHANLVRIQVQGLRSNDCWYRRTGRTTRGLLTFLAETVEHAKGRRLQVSSPYGPSGSCALARQCLDLADCLGIVGFEIVAESGGYVDHGRFLPPPTNLYADAGIVHAWNAPTSITCLECLALNHE